MIIDKEVTIIPSRETTILWGTDPSGKRKELGRMYKNDCNYSNTWFRALTSMLFDIPTWKQIKAHAERYPALVITHVRGLRVLYWITFVKALELGKPIETKWGPRWSVPRELWTEGESE